jgi:cytochrome c-type biogenesis protein
MSNVGYIGAFLGGVLSFLSPCVLPLIPSYVSFITGISFEDFKTGDKKRIRRLTLINSSSFIAGFSTVFILLGVFSSYMNYLLTRSFSLFGAEITVYQIGGAVIIFFGLYVMGILKLNFLSRDKRVHLQSRPKGHMGAFIIGITFGAGWTPCIGPILGAILVIAGTSGSAMYGFKLLTVYSLGLAIPFLATSLAINTFLSHFKAIHKYMRIIMFLSGLLLIAFGIILLTEKMHLLLNMAPDLEVEKLLSH